MKRILTAAVLLLLLLVAVVLLRARALTSLQPPPVEPVTIQVDAGAIAARFAGALRYPTISNQDRAEIDRDAFLGLHEYLRQSFPRVHATLERETVNDLSLLYTWRGSEPDLPPVLLMGHLDVVPVIPGTEAEWRHPPFAGEIADGQVWGRGALDDKSTVVSLLEAVEALLADGFRPRHTIYLAFGHDEEVGGPQGAARIAETLAARGVQPYALVLDEGGAIVDGMVPGVAGPVAIIGIAEKGFLSLELRVDGEGGHSSTPPEHTAIGILARAITRLEEHPFPARLDGAVEAMFRYLAPEMGLGGRIAFANLWLFRPFIVNRLLSDRTSASMVRTTTAVTMVRGGVKDNVLPITATAVVNHRILPGETRATVIERVRAIVDDERVQIRDVSSSQDPSPVSDPDSEPFRLLGRTIRQVVDDPELAVAPYLVMGGTDAKWYAGRSPFVFRFLPVRIGAEGLRLAHGTNERISVENLVLAVRTFIQLIRNTDELHSPA